MTPEPILKGRFNLYETPSGGFHIAYVADDETETRHLEIPAMVVRMAKASAEGKLNPMQALKEMMSSGV
jgi:hypothetical protein